MTVIDRFHALVMEGKRTRSVTRLTSKRYRLVRLAEAGWCRHCREACCVIYKYMPGYCEVRQAAEGAGSTPSRNAEFIWDLLAWTWQVW
jgi:hypothetical protein